jgi:hypothetical protein
MRPFAARCGDRVRRADGPVLVVVAYEGGGALHCQHEGGGAVEVIDPGQLLAVTPRPAPAPVRAARDWIGDES